MPCYDSRDECGEYENRELLKALQASRVKVNAVTRVACELAKEVRAAPSLWETLTEATRQWVEHHEEWDARRLKADSNG